MDDVVLVTRHPSLIEYFKELGLVDEDTPIVPFAKRRDVEGKHVMGVLPLSLAVHAKMLTVIPMHVPEHMRDQVLTLEEVRKYASDPITVQITPVSEDKLITTGRITPKKRE